MANKSSELLNKAAVAAGTDFRNLLSHGKWDPLNDDGDEARLEAQLQMHVEWHPATETVTVGTAAISCTEPYGRNRQAARRRAGVRAAAELGSSA